MYLIAYTNIDGYLQVGSVDNKKNTTNIVEVSTYMEQAIKRNLSNYQLNKLRNYRTIIINKNNKAAKYINTLIN